MELHLEGKHVVITGGATGIGKAAALEFAREGAAVSVCGRTMEKLVAMQKECEKQGFQVDIYQADVSDTKAMEAMAKEVAEKNDGIDVWVNNAGIAIDRPVLDFTKEDYDRVMQIDLEGVFEGCRIAGRHMIRQGRGGVIINASSFASKIPHTEGAIYAAAKSGVSSFTKTFAANFAPYGIRVVGYIPGMIQTDIAKDAISENRDLYTANVALKRLGVPEDLAKPLVFLASDACGYVTGFDFEISGGKYIVQDPGYSWDRKGKE
ncbi:MAG: SDR family oxidoreductase [Lachnospiraceae bacterium]|nr:SDR family oxidoreductase [Lachnospiraceae bacterium]